MYDLILLVKRRTERKCRFVVFRSSNHQLIFRLLIQNFRDHVFGFFWLVAGQEFRVKLLALSLVGKLNNDILREYEVIVTKMILKKYLKNFI